MTAVVDVPAVFDRGEHRRKAERQDDDADHLQHGHQRGRSSRRCRRPTRTRLKLIHAQQIENVGEREREQPGADVVLGEHVGELVGGDAEGDHERQVEEQLQRRRHPVLLVRVAARHPADAVHLRRHRPLRFSLTH